MVFLQAERLLGMLFDYGACCLSVMDSNPALLTLTEKLPLWVIPCPCWRDSAPNEMSVTWLKLIFFVRSIGCCHKEPGMNMNVPQASPRSRTSQSKDAVKLPSPWYNYWVKWAVCNYDDIKPDKIFGPDSLLIYTGMNQETVRGDLGQREFFR